MQWQVPRRDLSTLASTASPSPIKACRIHRFGLPEVITLEDINRPEPGESEVLVRVKAKRATTGLPQTGDRPGSGRERSTSRGMAPRKRKLGLKKPKPT